MTRNGAYFRKSMSAIPGSIRPRIISFGPFKLLRGVPPSNIFGGIVEYCIMSPNWSRLGGRELALGLTFTISLSAPCELLLFLELSLFRPYFKILWVPDTPDDDISCCICIF